MHFGTWLTTQRANATAQGLDYRDMACHPARLTVYVRQQLDVAITSLEDAQSLTPELARPAGEQRERWETSREVFVTHVVDALEAVGFLLNAVGCDTSELEESYEAADVDAVTDVKSTEDACGECKTAVDDDAIDASMGIDDALAYAKNKHVGAHNHKTPSDVCGSDLHPRPEVSGKTVIH